MKKLIFGVFSKNMVSQLKMLGHHIELDDKNTYKALSKIVSYNVATAQQSAHDLFETIGLPLKTARVYAKELQQKTNKLIAVVVPLEMEEHTRTLFKQLRADTMSTVNC